MSSESVPLGSPAALRKKLGELRVLYHHTEFNRTQMIHAAILSIRTLGVVMGFD